MAEEKQEEVSVEQPKKSKSKLFIIIGAVAVVLIAGGVGAYFMLSGGGKEKKEEAKHAEEDSAHTVLVPLDPFIVNLSDMGRFLKVTINLELKNAKEEETVKQKTPLLRDAVITLISSKSAESISGPEGKIQLKDELLFRLNKSMGKDAFKNLYFTDFVMQ